MKLNIVQIEQIANLARLKLNQNEKNLYAEQLSVVFDYIEMLEEGDTDNVKETYQVTGLLNVVRDDKPEISDVEAVKSLVDCFPDKIRNLLKVKAVFGDES